MVSVTLLIRAARGRHGQHRRHSPPICRNAAAAPQMTYQPMPLVVRTAGGRLVSARRYRRRHHQTSDFRLRAKSGSTIHVQFRRSSTASMGDTIFFGVGVGYEFNNWLRFDVTGEYRAKADVQRRRHLHISVAAFPRPIHSSLKSDGLPGQRLCRSRHLELRHAVCRLRHRRRLNTFAQSHRYRYRHVMDRLRHQQPANGISPGRCMPALPTTSRRTSPWNSPIATSITVRSATRSTAWEAATPTTYKLQNLTSNDFMLGMRWRFPIESSAVTTQQARSWCSNSRRRSTRSRPHR